MYKFEKNGVELLVSKFPSELICDVLVFMAKIARHIEAKMN